jgi:lipoate-protein ligase A
MEGRLAMSVDETLAESVGNGASPPVARLYGFSPPTLSLGRFQKVRGSVDLARLAADGVTLVRRPTGGHAVLHDDALTYAVILPKSGSWADARKREVYEFIARVLLAGLAELGITGSINAARTGDLHNPDCFGSAGEYEITTAGRKLIGSAQMTTRTAVLQHGSIPLSNPGGRVLRYIHASQPGADAGGAPSGSGEPTCLDEQAGRDLSFQEVRDAFCRAFLRELDAVITTMRPEEDAAAERIRAARYASDEWNLRS